MGKCHADGCNNEIFSHFFCKYHQYKRKQFGGDLYERKAPKKPKQKRIPRESKSRHEDAEIYKQVKEELRAEMMAQGTYNCFFCTKPMGSEFQFHHLKGREGKNFIDRRYLVPGHNQCHVWDYHHSCVEQLLKLPWYRGFLNRLKAIDPVLYREELKKQEKANLFSDES